MRRVLIDYARRKRVDKQSQGKQREFLEAAAVFFDNTSTDLLALDHALKEFAALDPQGAQVVELRFFGGLSVEETAKVIGISDRTVKRDWRAARAWLSQNIGER
jgi:RNA polymerase sigma factor (TIGR02999 family)